MTVRKDMQKKFNFQTTIRSMNIAVYPAKSIQEISLFYITTIIITISIAIGIQQASIENQFLVDA